MKNISTDLAVIAVAGLRIDRSLFCHRSIADRTANGSKFRERCTKALKVISQFQDLICQLSDHLSQHPGKINNCQVISAYAMMASVMPQNERKENARQKAYRSL
jgi:hypothetical protein